MRKRLLSALVAFCMALTLMPSWAFAGGEEPAPDQTSGEEGAIEIEENVPSSPEEDGEPIETTVSVDLSGIEAKPGDELLEDYLRRIMGLDESGISLMYGDGGGAAYDLSSAEQALYTAILNHAESLIDPDSNVTGSQLSITTSHKVPYDGITGDSFSLVLAALMQDHPETFFWYDRNSFQGVSISVEKDPGTGYLTGTLPMKVTRDYRTGESAEFTFNKSVMSRVNAALQRAQDIVDNAAGLDDAGKLAAYRDAICRLTSYNWDAAGEETGGTANMGENPWQIIDVFDNDPGTKVVCEGYSKAFQYLCNLTDFDGSVRCYIATGDCGGDHMWNVVVIDGAGYLADVTNADVDDVQAGGQTYHLNGCLDGFFLMGQTGSGRTYTASRPSKDFDIDGGTLTVGGGTLTYTYDADVDLGLLNLSAADYQPPRTLRGTVEITGANEIGRTLTATAAITSGSPGALTYQWVIGGKTVSTASAYTLKADDAGKTVTVTVTAANYDTGISASFVACRLKTPQAEDFTFRGETSYEYTGSSLADTLKGLISSTEHAGHYTVHFWRYRGTDADDPRNAGGYQLLVDVEKHGGYDAAENITVALFDITPAVTRLTISGGSTVSPGSPITLTANVPELSGLRLADKVTWRVSDDSAAAISPAAGPETTVTALTPGKTVTVTAVLPDDDGFDGNYTGSSATKEIAVTALDPIRLVFTRPALANDAYGVALGDSLTVTAGLDPGAARNPDSADIRYSSSDPSVAAVGETDGVITALGRGTAVITAAAREIPGQFAEGRVSFTLTVAGRTITPSIEIVPPDGGFVDGGFPYTGRPVTPNVTVSYTDGGGVHQLDSKYYHVVCGEDTINAGTVALTIVPADPEDADFTWTTVEGGTSFEIVKAAVDPADLPTVTAIHSKDARGPRTRDIGRALSRWAPTSIRLKDGQTYAHVENVALTGGVLSYDLLGNGSDGDSDTITVVVRSRNYKDFEFSAAILLKEMPPEPPFDPEDLELTFSQDDEGRIVASIAPRTGAEYSREESGGFGAENAWTVLPGEAVTVYMRRAGRNPDTPEETLPSDAVSVTKVAPPSTSPYGGRISGASTVTLAANADIYYTTDGKTEPCCAKDGSLPEGVGKYDPAEPLVVLPGTTLKVLACRDGETPEHSETVTVTFTRRSSISAGGGGALVIGGNSAGTAPGSGTAPGGVSGVSSASGVTTAAPSAAVKDGVANAAVTGALGRELADQAAAHDSDTVVIAPSIPAAAGRTDVTIGSGVLSDLSGRTSADLRVETPAADVTISNRGLYALANKGGSVVVSAGADGNTVDVRVIAGGSTLERVTGGITVSIPANCTYGTVAMTVKADGSTEPVRKSVANASSGVVTVPLEGSAVITLADNSKFFGDVPAGSAFANAVAFVSSREIMNGTGAGTFNPNAPLTRAQLTKILHNLENNPSVTDVDRFSDVPIGFWSAEAILWAAGQGIVTGYADGSFMPDRRITREQLAVMLFRYAGSPKVQFSELRFRDASSVGAYAREAMTWAVQNGVINGKSGNLLDPKGQATRAQAAQMLLNYMNSLG